ncbi:MAG: hypothetical protein AB1696_08825 [Planctomycetota bacterium]
MVGVLALGGHWTRAWCGVFLGIWFLGLAGALMTDQAPVYSLAYPLVLWLVAVFVRGVVRMIERV